VGLGLGRRFLMNIQEAPSFIRKQYVLVRRIDELGFDSVMKHCVGKMAVQYCTSCGLCDGKCIEHCELAAFMEFCGINTL
jgi:ferredoxin